MYKIGKLHGVLYEEHGNVVADEIPVAFIRIKLDRKAAHVAGGIGRATLTRDRREAHEDGCTLIGLRKDRGPCDLGQTLVALKEAMCCRTTGVDDSLRNALMIEVGDLFAKDEVFEEG